MTNPRRRRLPHFVVAAAATVTLALAPALPASAAPVVSEVPDGLFVGEIVEYDGLLYTSNGINFRSYDGTTFTVIPGAPQTPDNFVEYLGDLWMLDTPAIGEAALWRFDGTTFTEIADAVGQPVVIGGRLYFIASDAATGDRVLAWTDGTTVTTPPGSPTDVREIAVGPGGGVVFTASPDLTLWTFDGTADFAEVTAAGAPVDVDQLTTVSGGVVFDGQEVAGGDDTAYSWDGVAFRKLAPSGGGAIDPGCFSEYAGTLYYSANDGTRRLFSAVTTTVGSETAVIPEIADGCLGFVASDGTLYLYAQGTGANPTLHTWNGTTLTELDTTAYFPGDFVEYGGKIYFVAQPVSETPALYVLEDAGEPGTPSAPTLPPTGGQVSPVLIAIAGVLVLGGAGILVVARRPRGV